MNTSEQLKINCPGYNDNVQVQWDNYDPSTHWECNDTFASINSIQYKYVTLSNYTHV